jgi:hypothetical protein
MTLSPDPFAEALELMAEVENRVAELSASLQVRETQPGRRLTKFGKVEDAFKRLGVVLRREARQRGAI